MAAAVEDGKNGVADMPGWAEMGAPAVNGNEQINTARMSANGPKSQKNRCSGLSVMPALSDGLLDDYMAIKIMARMARAIPAIWMRARVSLLINPARMAVTAG